MEAGANPWSEPPLASNIRKWRERRRLSLSQLARDAEISKSTVSELERGHGNPSLDTLVAIARSLNLPLGVLFNESHIGSDVDIRRLADAPVIAHIDDVAITHLLSGWVARAEIELSVLTIAAGGRVDSDGDAPGSVRRVVCVEGVVEVGTPQRSDLLTQADLITFPGDQQHFLRAVNGAARVILLEQYPPSA